MWNRSSKLKTCRQLELWLPVALVLLLVVVEPTPVVGADAYNTYGFKCPDAEIQIHPGDLSVLAAIPGFTYRLKPGQYTVSSPLNYMTTGGHEKCSIVSTCFVGDCEHRNEVTIKNTLWYAVTVGANAELGLQHLSIDGERTAGGVNALPGSTLVMQDVAINNCANNEALHADGATVSLSSVSFVNNHLPVRAPVVVAGDGTYKWEEVDFRDNCGTFGGALYVHENTKLILAGALFTGNLALQMLAPPAPLSAGGAVFLATDTLLLLEHESTFIGNHADDDGGAIAMRDSAKVVITGKALFSSNAGASGGAISVGGSHAHLEISGHSSFLGNFVGSGSGGAISIGGVKAKCSLTGDNDFDANYVNAGDGGAISVGSFAKLDICGDTSFAHNYVTTGNGGALSTWPNARVVQSGSTTFVSNYVSTGNGGAIDMGGTDSQLALMGQSSFTGNYATVGNGGALAIEPFAFVDVAGKFCAQNNQASTGGGIYVAAAPSTEASLLFSSAHGHQQMANNIPDDIEVQAGASFTCATDPSNPKTVGQYSITGPVCGCSPADNGTSTCGCSNSTAAWNAAACACQTAALQVQLNPSRAFASCSDSVVLVASAVDLNNTPVSGVQLTFTSYDDDGQYQPGYDGSEPPVLNTKVVTTNASGEASVHVASGDPGRITVVATATKSGKGRSNVHHQHYGKLVKSNAAHVSFVGEEMCPHDEPEYDAGYDEGYGGRHGHDDGYGKLQGEGDEKYVRVAAAGEPKGATHGLKITQAPGGMTATTATAAAHHT